VAALAIINFHPCVWLIAYLDPIILTPNADNLNALIGEDEGNLKINDLVIEEGLDALFKEACNPNNPINVNHGNPFNNENDGKRPLEGVLNIFIKMLKQIETRLDQ